MPSRSFQKRLIVTGKDNNPTYLRDFDFKTRKVGWTSNRSEAQRLGPTDILLASHLLRGKELEYRVVRETHLKMCQNA